MHTVTFIVSARRFMHTFMMHTQYTSMTYAISKSQAHMNRMQCITDRQRLTVRVCKRDRDIMQYTMYWFPLPFLLLLPVLLRCLFFFFFVCSFLSSTLFWFILWWSSYLHRHRHTRSVCLVILYVNRTLQPPPPSLFTSLLCCVVAYAVVVITVRRRCSIICLCVFVRNLRKIQLKCISQSLTSDTLKRITNGLRAHAYIFTCDKTSGSFFSFAFQFRLFQFIIWKKNDFFSSVRSEFFYF